MLSGGNVQGTGPTAMLIGVPARMAAVAAVLAITKDSGFLAGLMTASLRPQKSLPIGGRPVAFRWKASSPIA